MIVENSARLKMPHMPELNNFEVLVQNFSLAQDFRFIAIYS